MGRTGTYFPLNDRCGILDLSPVSGIILHLQSMNRNKLQLLGSNISGRPPIARTRIEPQRPLSDASTSNVALFSNKIEHALDLAS